MKFFFDLILKYTNLILNFRSFRGFYNEWNRDPRNKFYNDKGNVCAPRFELVLGWIADAWAQLPEDQIARSFIQCGVGSRVTGDYHNYLKEMIENGK